MFERLLIESEDKCTGLPVGNFGISAEVPLDGRVFSRVLYNPPVLGEWLQELGRGDLRFSCDGITIRDLEFENREVDRLFPEASVAYSDARFKGLDIKVNCLAPIKAGDAFPCSLPALCVDIECLNSLDEDREVTAEYRFRFDVDEAHIRLFNSGGFWMAGDDKVKLGFDRALVWKGVEGGIAVSARVAVPPQSSASIRFLLACYHPDGLYTEKLPDMPALVEHVSTNWEQFWMDREEFVNLLPKTHDERIDRYLRWYLQAGVLLTRVTREHVLTMGYRELNQRDSFWTSWPHLVIWPELEKRMILESAEFQRADGKIPTTILPIIEREDDIDINEYFNIRVARYYAWTHDMDLVKKVWPNMKRSIEYLKTRDTDGDGLLDQGSYWGDWKDVKGVLGRKAAPHFEFLWAAVLKSAVEFAEKLGDKEAARDYNQLYERVYSVVNTHIDEGGLWNGKFYTSRWYDGRTDDHVQEDQFVGPLFKVVPEERIRSIFASMAPNMAPWGVRDTYPYREKFSHAGGDYHNGGIWPFLNFGDALTRFTTGYLDGAFDILTRVGEWDFEKQGDYLPAEYLDGETGANAGFAIQGWDADYHAAVFFGLLGVEMTSKNAVRIMPRIPDSVDFETPLMLPGGALHIKQTHGNDGLEVEIRSEMKRKVSIQYGAMTGMNTPDGHRERIGECEFCVVDVGLSPGEVCVIRWV